MWYPDSNAYTPYPDPYSYPSSLGDDSLHIHGERDAFAPPPNSIGDFIHLSSSRPPSFMNMSPNPYPPFLTPSMVGTYENEHDSRMFSNCIGEEVGYDYNGEAYGVEPNAYSCVTPLPYQGFQENSFDTPQPYQPTPPFYQEPYSSYQCETPMSYDSPNEPHFEDTLSQFIQFQEERNNRVDETLNDIKSQLTLLINALVASKNDKNNQESVECFEEKDENREGEVIENLNCEGKLIDPSLECPMEFPTEHAHIGEDINLGREPLPLVSPLTYFEPLVPCPPKPLLLDFNDPFLMEEPPTFPSITNTTMKNFLPQPMKPLHLHEHHKFHWLDFSWFLNLHA